MAGQSSVIEYVGTAVRIRNAQRPSRATHRSTPVLPALVHALLRETDLVCTLSAKQVCLYSISYPPRVKLSVTEKLGGERSRS